MSAKSVGLSDQLHAYVIEHTAPEPPILARLREETARHPLAMMQIAPEQGPFMSLMVELTGARRIVEVGTFTGYSSLAMALALPPGGRIVCCDISEEYTSVARRYWAEAGVSDRVELRLGPATATLDAMLAAGEAGGYDLAFLDADKTGYVDYYPRLIELLRPGGLLLVDNVLSHERVLDPANLDPNVVAIRAFNDLVAADPRVSIAMIPLADGVTLARKR